MITIALIEEPNWPMLQEQIKAQFVHTGISGDSSTLYVQGADAIEVNRAAIEAIVARHDPTQITQPQQEHNRRANDKSAQYNEIRQSPRAYAILQGEMPKPMTNGDIEILADIVRYMFNELEIDMPEWTLAARS